MVDDGGWLVAQAFARGQHTFSKLGIFVADLAARPRTQVCSESTVAFKDLLAESHVGAEGSFSKDGRLGAQIKESQRGQ